MGSFKKATHFFVVYSKTLYLYIQIYYLNTFGILK